MIINNKLLRIDLVLLIAVVSLAFMKPGRWSEILTGFTGAVFFISIVNHVRHYISYKKFY
ncbi:MAG TPA: hypothetical protein DIC22_12060 [Chitinophagaceae bacterium]|jgi:hypothetical protein|nr:hypothetical protein [Chitinophagaceae bacterium]